MGENLLYLSHHWNNSTVVKPGHVMNFAFVFFQFAHSVLPEDEPRTHETCTSTGIMLSQVKSSLPEALNSERYPKWKIQQVCMWSRWCSVWYDCCFFAIVMSQTRALEDFIFLTVVWLLLLLDSSQKSRDYPVSGHDNKEALRDNISVFSHVSMKKNSG